MNKSTICEPTTFGCVEHLTNKSAVRRDGTRAICLPSWRRFPVGASYTRCQLHCLEVCDIRAPPKVMTCLQFTILPVVEIYRYIFVTLGELIYLCGI